MLNKEQQESKDLILDYCFNQVSYDYIWITGSAGTGKTYTIGKAMNDLNDFRICISAPTQRAVAELKKKSPKVEGYRTVHSLLGLRDDEKSFDIKFIKQAQVTINNYDIIFIDESSMINEELFDLLMYYKGNTKFVFIGDIEQLAPVTGKQPNLFVDTDKVRGVRLVKIERQAESSPIIDLATHLLNHLSFPELFIFNENTVGATYIANSKFEQDKDFIKSIITELFCSDQYKLDSAYAKVACATNKMVEEMNKFIRNKMYGCSATNKILVGEKMIATGRHLIDNEVVLVNNDEFVVESFEIKMETIDNLPFFYYFCDVSLTSREAYGKVRILHERSEANYKIICDKFEKAKKLLPKQSSGYYELAKQWKSFLAYFALVDYSMALTCHKLQGSTIKNVVVLANDLFSVKPWGNDTKRRWLYTAVTRASEKVYIIT